MATDYPDYTRLFYLTGTAITIPISIEASEVTLPVSIDAATVTVNVNLESSDITLNVNLANSEITLNVDVVAQTVGSIAVDITAQTVGDISVNIATSAITLNVAMGSMPFESTAENLLTNPGFEDGNLTGWYKSGAGSLTVQGAEKWKGDYAAKFEPNLNQYVLAIAEASKPCYPGQRLLVSAAMKADANITQSNLAVSFRSAEDVHIDWGFSAHYGGDYDWTAKVATFEVPDGVALFRVAARFMTEDPVGVGYADSFIAARLVQPALDSSLNLNINIVAQEIATLDINIAASDITVNINFYGQTTAVFGAAKWFARQAAQVFVTGNDSVPDNDCRNMIDYTVPADKILYVVGFAYRVSAGAAVPGASAGDLIVGASRAVTLGSKVGGGMPFDTPLRATEGVHVYLPVCHYGAGAALTCWGSMWGYLEAE